MDAIFASPSSHQSIYQELKHIAKIHRRKWSGNTTLNTTALINEAWLKMNRSDAQYNSKTHFYATAARAMRQVLINYAERSHASKRYAEELSIENLPLADNSAKSAEEVLLINQLLDQLEKKNSRGVKIIECRIFGGMTIRETSDALGLSVSTIKREWALLSAWLYHELDPCGKGSREPIKRP